MRINFDIQFGNPNWVNELSSEEVVIYGTVLTFLEQRFILLEADMEKEWEATKAHIVIQTPKNGKDFGIFYRGFSQKTQDRLNGSISDEDLTYIANLLVPYFHS